MTDAVCLRPAIATVVLLLSLIEAQHVPKVTREPQPQAVETVVKATGYFSTALYRVLTKNSKNNLQFSPLNIAALLVAITDSKSPTTARSQILHALDLNSSVDSSLTEGFSKLFSTYNASELKMFDFGNRMFADVASGLANQFKDLLEKAYLTSLQLLDFREKPEDSGRAVATWLESMTRYEVSFPIQESDFYSNTTLLLASTSFMQARWDKRYFRPENTRWEHFYPLSGRQRYARFMHCYATFKYTEYEGIKILQLPLEGGRLFMWIMLPIKPEGFADLEKRIDFESVTNVPHLTYQNVVVSLPRFELQSSLKLKGALKRVGVVDVFTEGVDVPGTNDSQAHLVVDNVIVRSYLEVNEQEKEEELPDPSRKSGEREFVANRPFIVLVRDSLTESILLIGRVVDIKS